MLRQPWPASPDVWPSGPGPSGSGTSWSQHLVSAPGRGKALFTCLPTLPGLTASFSSHRPAGASGQCRRASEAPRAARGDSYPGNGTRTLSSRGGFMSAHLSSAGRMPLLPSPGANSGEHSPRDAAARAARPIGAGSPLLRNVSFCVTALPWSPWGPPNTGQPLHGHDELSGLVPNTPSPELRTTHPPQTSRFPGLV